MIDFHSHLLPGIDDGSRSAAETMQMLKLEYEQGIYKIVATPHFYASRHSIEHFLSRRSQSMNEAEEAMPAGESLPGIIPGAEVYYFPGMGKAAPIQKLCIQDTNILLLELPFCQWTGDILEDVRDLLHKQNLTVMIAHVERYYEFQRDKSVWNEIINLAPYLQINADCFLKWRNRRLGFELLRSRDNIVLGSDCHNMKNRSPNLQSARDIIEKKVSDSLLEQIDQLGERLLR